VIAAADALIGSTDGHLRWLIYRGGEAEFFRLCREKFRLSEPAITFTDEEMRWMFQCVEASIPERFRHAQAADEIAHLARKAISDAQLKGDTLDGDGTVDGHEGPSDVGEDGVTTETLRDSDKAPLVH
jgi:hypothetical protein